MRIAYKLGIFYKSLFLLDYGKQPRVQEVFLFKFVCLKDGNMTSAIRCAQLL